MQKISDFFDSRAGFRLMAGLLVTVFIAMPILVMLFDVEGRFLPSPVTRVFASMANLFGNFPARLILCTAWLAFGIALFRVFVMRKPSQGAHAQHSDSQSP